MPEIAAASAWVLAVVVAAAIVHRFVAFAVVVQSESMRPSLQPGDVILAGRARRRTRLRRGEILVYRDADAGDRRIRRLIALPGDHVEIGDDGAVTVDGDPLFEPYARRTGGFRGAFTVPGDRCFVLS
ncbi:signal peptidase I, partial [Agromyces sp. CCNWLW208]